MIIEDKINRFASQLEGIENTCNNVCESVFNNNSDACVEQVRSQLMLGVGGDGADLSPKYVEDSYFKSPAAAERYVAWKVDAFRVDVPASGAPNLYINGYFHSTLYMDVTNTGCSIESGALFAQEIWGKYGKDKFGISDEFYNRVIREQIINGLKQELYERI